MTEYVSENLESIKCIFTGKCYVNEYEYTFYFNDNEYITDKCFTNFYGKSYCESNDVVYSNVSYESRFIRKYEKNNYPIGTVMLIFIIFILIWKNYFNLFYVE